MLTAWIDEIETAGQSNFSSSLTPLNNNRTLALFSSSPHFHPHLFPPHLRSLFHVREQGPNLLLQGGQGKDVSPDEEESRMLEVANAVR